MILGGSSDTKPKLKRLLYLVFSLIKTETLPFVSILGADPWLSLTSAAARCSGAGPCGSTATAAAVGADLLESMVISNSEPACTCATPPTCACAHRQARPRVYSTSR